MRGGCGPQRAGLERELNARREGFERLTTNPRLSKTLRPLWSERSARRNEWIDGSYGWL